MKQILNLLLNKLDGRHISKHVICPSAYNVLHDISLHIEDPIEIIDERSACYVATGICEEIGSPVVIWCANNDSYRNLSSALTEAYYRKLPILVIALSCENSIDQSMNPQDTIRYYINYHSDDTNLDKAIDLLHADVKGPVYLSLGNNPFQDKKEWIKNSSERIDASEISSLIPSGACVHIGPNIDCKTPHIKDVYLREDHCTKDGNLSMLIGASLINKNQLHIGIFTIDELSYDLNMFGNRHVGNNIAVISIKQNDKSCFISDFAEKMGWDCKHFCISGCDELGKNLVISDKPQYIEVSL